MTERTLVLGGARSGKSAYAESGLDTAAAVTYVATARRYPDDDEWEARIAAHVARRPGTWTTVEPTDLPRLLRCSRAGDPPLLVDDVATWLAGVLDDTSGWDGALAAAREDCSELVDALAACRCRTVLVSAEVGLGVVPSTGSGRLFRDELGALNARLAEICEEVRLLVAGIPLRLK